MVCPCCGKVRPELWLREQSQEIGWEVGLVRRRHVRFRYGPSCQCPQGWGIRTAPKPTKLIAKGLLAVEFWVEVLLKKFELAQPLQRTIREVAAHGMHLSAGTLSGGLKKIKAMVQPLAGQFVLQSRQGAHWHLDETRWPMFCLQQARGRQWWWFWVVVSPDFLDELRKAAKETGLSTADTIRQSAKLGLPKLLEQMGSDRVTNVAPLPNKVARTQYSQPDDDSDAIRVFMAAQTKRARE